MDCGAAGASSSFFFTLRQLFRPNPNPTTCCNKGGIQLLPSLSGVEKMKRVSGLFFFLYYAIFRKTCLFSQLASCNLMLEREFPGKEGTVAGTKVYATTGSMYSTYCICVSSLSSRAGFSHVVLYPYNTTLIIPQSSSPTPLCSPCRLEGGPPLF